MQFILAPRKLGRFHAETVVVIAMGLLACISRPAGAQWPPDSLVNLQIFPKDTMRGFASALRVPCIHCHVGDDPNDLSTTDFPSDDRPTKRKARR